MTEIWIRTEPTMGRDGAFDTFSVVVEIGEDRSIVLDEATALTHARILLRACQMAEYDSSVYRQMKAVLKGEAESLAYQVVTDLQKDRAPFDLGDTEPFGYVPGLTRKERDPVIQVRIDDQVIGVWDLEAARSHAFALVEAPLVAELDGAYLRVLRGVIGLEEDRARNVVDDLANHRPSQ